MDEELIIMQKMERNSLDFGSRARSPAASGYFPTAHFIQENLDTTNPSAKAFGFSKMATSSPASMCKKRKRQTTSLLLRMMRRRVPILKFGVASSTAKMLVCREAAWLSQSKM